MLSDEKIIQLFFDRSEEAIVALDQKYGAVCRALADNLLSDPQDAEECINDTYLAAWNTIPPQRPAPLRSYLLRILRNRCIARFHNNHAQKRSCSYQLALSELEDCLAAPEGVEDARSARELTALLDRFLLGLSRQDRVLFLRRYWFGDSVTDIARHCRLSPNHVSVKLLRLRQKLRQQLEKEGFVP